MIQFSSVLYSQVWCNTMEYSQVWYSTLEYSILRVRYGLNGILFCFSINNVLNHKKSMFHTLKDVEYELEK